MIRWSYFRGLLPLALLGLFVTFLAVGCAHQPLSSWSGGLFFSADDEDEVPGIKPASAQMEELQALAAAAESQSNAQQRQICEELSQRIQSEEDPLLRREIVRTLGHYRLPTASAVLAAGLEDTDRQVRIACCEAWSQRGDAEAVEILADVLRSDTDIDVKLAAARALGGTENAAALGPLAETLDESDPSLQRRSIASLQQVSGRDFGNDAAAWRQFAKTGAVDKTPSIAERVGGWFR